MTYLCAVASHLPRKRVLNQDLDPSLNTSDHWITTRTGIKQRHIADDGQTTSDLAFLAAQKLLAKTTLLAQDLDGIIVATTTPERTFPAVATHVQQKLGLTSGFAFDIQAVCSGFVYGLSVAHGLLASGQAKRLILIGAEVMSGIVDWSDRSTCVLFGDGAGAVLLSNQPEDQAFYTLPKISLPKNSTLNNSSPPKTSINQPGLCYINIQANGAGINHLCTNGPADLLTMNGKEVFRQATTKMTESVQHLCQTLNWHPSDINWVVPHQANARILKSVAEKIGFTPDQVVQTVSQHANTSAASIPLALDTVFCHIKPGDKVVFVAMGGGYTWGSAAFIM
jgi:3-oxoacyl-[acyl-carrier-protein] synthase-3